MYRGSRSTATPERQISATGVTGFILAGAETTRMGRDKALLALGGTPLILHTAYLVASVVKNPPVVIGTSEPDRSLGLRVVEDDGLGAGPLGGIATALRASETEWSLLVACDQPYLTKRWLDFIVATRWHRQRMRCCP